MADFGTLSNADTLQTIETASTLRREDLEIPKFDMESATALGNGDDFMSRMGEMTKQAEQNGQTENSLQVSLDIDMNVISQAFENDTKTDQLLAEANVLLRKKEHSQAKSVLAEILDAHDEHHEALYFPS